MLVKAFCGLRVSKMAERPQLWVSANRRGCINGGLRGDFGLELRRVMAGLAVLLAKLGASNKKWCHAREFMVEFVRICLNHRSADAPELAV